MNDIKLFKITNAAFLLSLILTLSTFALIRNNAYAQIKVSADNKIDIWNSNKPIPARHYICYEFTLYVFGIRNIIGNNTLKNFTIKTSEGDIKFDEIDSSQASRYPSDILFVQEEISSLQILKATGEINGVVYDFTDAMNPVPFKPVKIYKRR